MDELVDVHIKKIVNDNIKNIILIYKKIDQFVFLKICEYFARPRNTLRIIQIGIHILSKSMLRTK